MFDKIPFPLQSYTVAMLKEALKDKEQEETE